jgi:hypothetical protein
MFLDQDFFNVFSVSMYFHFLEMCVKFLIHYFGPLLEGKGNHLDSLCVGGRSSCDEGHDELQWQRSLYMILLSYYSTAAELLKKSALWWKLNVSQLMKKFSARLEILKTPFLEIYVCWMLGRVDC